MSKNKLKSLIHENSDGQGTDKKKIENLVFCIVVLIITAVAINIIWSGKDKKNTETNNSTKQLAVQNQTKEEVQPTENLEEKLEKILSNIQGVGDIKVCLNYNESDEIIAMYNEISKSSTTEETDTSGETRKIEENDLQKDIIFKEEDGEKKPITQKIVQAKIEGAIITAKGAGNASIKTNIIQAVEAITGLATHKIQVFEMN